MTQSMFGKRKVNKRKPLFPGIAGQATVTTSGEAESSRQAALETTFDIVSSRSRASSIISTGTKTSINTLPLSQTESHSGPIDVVVGARNFRISARPGSILSISSFDHPAPPYSAVIGANASESTATLTGPSSAPPSPPLPPSDETDPLTPIPRRPQLEPFLTSLSEPIRRSSLDTSRSSSPPSPPLSPLSSSTNAISAHYTTVVRTIDTNHLREIDRLKEVHAISLAQTRNDIDAAYRIPYREARDRGDRLAAETEALKQRAEERQAEFDALQARCEEAEAALKSLEEELHKTTEENDANVRSIESAAAVAVDQAKNEVEDLWESRWRDRMRLEAEETLGAWKRGRVQGLVEGAEEQSRKLAGIMDRVTASSVSMKSHGEIVKWKDEILKALSESYHSEVQQ